MDFGLPVFSLVVKRFCGSWNSFIYFEMRVLFIVNGCCILLLP